MFFVNMGMFFYSLPTLDFRIIFCILQKLVKEGGLSWIVISHDTNYLLNWQLKFSIGSNLSIVEECLKMVNM